MTRKLLPYEYDLIDALGVSKEEYLDFVAQQHVYEDTKEGTALDIRAEPVSIILAVVGILFQVVSILLMPKPKQPKGTDQTRDAVLAPRIGFNGAQDLAAYGDTVPLVYTNTAQNKNGGVRVSSLLLWSAILSFGNHQFMRLMMTIGAASIAQIDPDRTALGQFPAKDVVTSNVWQYYNPNGATRYNNEVKGDVRDPTTTFSKDTTAKFDLDGAVEGFSQAFSPTTGNAVGVTGFIPVNADVLILDNAGRTERKRVGIQFKPQENAVYWPDSDKRPLVPEGFKWNLHIANTSELLLTSDTSGLAVQDALRAAASQIDNAAIFKIGTALFRVAIVNYGKEGNSIEEANLYARLDCIRAGKMPRANYNLHHWQEVSAQIDPLRREIDKKNNQITSLEQSRDNIQVILTRGSTVLYLREIYQVKLNRINNELATAQAESSALQNQLNNLQAQNSPRAFHVKGLARIEEAAYASVTKCNVLDIALRFQAYRRISGRSSVYGTKQISYGHNASDNGVKPRTAMFTVWHNIGKKTNPDGTPKYTRLPYIFCCRGFNEQEVFTYLKLVTRNAGPQFIEIKLEPVVDSFTEIKTFTTRGFCYLNPNGPLITLGSGSTGSADLEVYFNGSRYSGNNRGDYPKFNKSPANTSETDLFNYDAFSNTSFSFDSSTEIKITAVTEQLIADWDTYGPNLYKDLSTLALHVVSGSGTKDLRSISAYVTEGKIVRLLPTTQDYFGNERTEDVDYEKIREFAKAKPNMKDLDANGARIFQSTSFAPDIFLDTVLDSANGIGRYASLHSVDVKQLAQSKRYCQRNKLFMDGLIADSRPWREFWAQVAPFSLLEFGKIGGKDTLVPALPYIKSTGRMTRAISITALFNQGNILEDTFKEEFIDYGASVQDVIITLVYRDVERGGVFPRNNSVEVIRTDTKESNAIRESIDISQFVTTRAQAILLGKYLCNMRRYNRRAIEFMTFPTDIFVMPGSYIYVETSNNQWDSIYTGRIESGGVLNVPLQVVPDGTYSVLTYGSTDGTRPFKEVVITDGAAPNLKSRAGDLFVLGKDVRSKRVFRVTEVTMEEEGETTIRAVEHPCDTNGQSYIAEGIASYAAGLFTIDGDPEVG